MLTLLLGIYLEFIASCAKQSSRLYCWSQLK